MRWSTGLALRSLAGVVRADPIALQVDALATGEAPMGLLVVQTDARPAEWIAAEAMIPLAAWMRTARPYQRT